MRQANHFRTIGLWALLILVGSRGFAAEAQTDAVSSDDDSQVKLKYKPLAGILLFGGAIAAGSLPGELDATPPACRWCDGPDPNAVDRWARNARWDKPCAAGRLSYWTLGVASAVALGPLSHEKSRHEWLVNAGSIIDAAAATVIVTQATKYAFRRERPNSNPCHTAGEKDSDRNLSFFSGHTALAFAVVASGHETARLRGQSRSGWLWAGGTAAALTGYFRVAGDRHHLTDVITGAGVGILIGTLIPRSLHQPKETPLDSARATSRETLTAGPPLIGITRSMESGGKRYLVQVGKGPGKSLQFGLSF